MRMGGIFGSGAVGALGLATDLTSVNWAGAWGTVSEAALKVACSQAYDTGIRHAIAKQSADRYGVAKQLGIGTVSQQYLTYLGDCYMNGYLAGQGDYGQPSTTTPKTASNIGDQVAVPVVGGSGTRVASWSGGACTSDSAIKFVQASLGVDVDGKWGPKSQAALAASGNKFADIATGCTGNVPHYGGTSGGTTSISPTSPDAVTPPKPSLLSVYSQSPIFWAILLAAGVGGYFYLSKPKKGKRGSRR